MRRRLGAVFAATALFILSWIGTATPVSAATRTPVGTVITGPSAKVKYTWMRTSAPVLYNDSRAVYTDTAYDTVGFLSSVDLTSNWETSFIRPMDSYVFLKHLLNSGNGYDTFAVRVESSLLTVTGFFIDADGDSAYDASDPPVSTVVSAAATDTVILVRVQAPASAVDGTMDTVRISASSSTGDEPSAETVMLVLRVDSQPPTRPSAISPTTNSETSSARPLFVWTGSTDTGAGVAYYRFMLDTFGLFTSSIFDTTSYDTDYVPPTDLMQGRYYWRVSAVDSVGNSVTSAESYIVRIDTGVTVEVLRPANRTDTRDAMVWYAWQSSDAETYTWQLARDTNFTTIVDAVTETRATSMIRRLPFEDTFFWRVIGRDTYVSYDTTSPWTIFLDSSVTQVSAAAPSSGHETSSASVVVSWIALTDSVGIDSYAIEASKSASFTSLVFADTVDVLRTTDTLANLYNDTYHWRVRGVDYFGNVGVNSTARGFIVDTAVARPTLTAPATGIMTTDSTPVFTWSAVADSVGIDSYVVEVSAVPAFAGLSFVDTVDGSVVTDTVSYASRLADTTYYWRVRAVDDLGNASAASDSSWFIVTTSVAVALNVPAAGHETNAAFVAFAWSDGYAETYTWQLAKDTTFATVTDSVVDTTVMSMVRSLSHGDTYYWRVIGRDRAGNIDTSAARGFLFDTSVAQVSAVSPADHTDTNATVTVTWSAVSDSVGIDSYAVEVSRTAAFTTLALVDTLDASVTSRFLTGLTDDTYYWRVRAVDDLGNVGANSTARSFLLDSGAPQITLNLPANGHETTNVRVVVSWTAGSDSAGIDSYVVEVSKSPAFTSLTFADTVDALRTSDTVTNLYNDTYYWRVRAVDMIGNVGVNSALRGFMVDTTPPTIILTSPSLGAVMTDTTPTLTWEVQNDSTGIDTFLVRVSTTRTFDTLVFSDTIDGALTSDTTTALWEDTYYWEVVAIDNVGNTTVASLCTFLIDVTMPTAPVLVSPLNNHETYNLQPVFVWQSSADTGSGIYAYRLDFSADSTFTTIRRVDTVLMSVLSAGVTASYRPSLALATETYYWRVVAVDNAGNSIAASNTPFKLLVVSPTATLWFDRAEYKGIRSTAYIRLVDLLASTSPNILESADVTVYSDADPIGITLTMTESNVGSSLFTAMLHFTGGMSDASTQKIRVNAGSLVTAKRVQSDGSVVQTTVRWYNESGQTPPADLNHVRTWPNPWNPTSGQPMVIQNLPADPSMSIEIYTLDMKKVRTLYNGNGITASVYGNAAEWDGRNDGGQYVASGVYIYMVRSSAGTIVRKITLVK